MLTGVVMAAGSLLMFRWELDHGSVASVQTAAVTTMVIFMAFQAGNARSDHRSVFTVPIRDNPFLVIATAATFAVHIGALYLPPTQALLRVAPLDLDTWVRMTAVAFSVLAVVEIDKGVRRRRIRA